MPSLWLYHMAYLRQFWLLFNVQVILNTGDRWWRLLLCSKKAQRHVVYLWRTFGKNDISNNINTWWQFGYAVTLNGNTHVSMLNVKKGRADINPSNNAYTCNVSYVGKTQTFVAHGPGCTQTHVQNLWDNAPKEDKLPRMTLTVDNYGVHLKSLEKPKQPDIKIRLKDVSYFCAEGGIHRRVFSWICSNDIERKLECHVVLCSSKEKPKLLAAHMSVAFSFAYYEHRSERERKERLAKLQSESGASSVTSHSSTLVQNLHYKLARERLAHLQHLHASPASTLNDYAAASASPRRETTSHVTDLSHQVNGKAVSVNGQTHGHVTSQSDRVSSDQATRHDGQVTPQTTRQNGTAALAMQTNSKDVIDGRQSTSSYSEQARKTLTSFLYKNDNTKSWVESRGSIDMHTSSLISKRRSNGMTSQIKYAHNIVCTMNRWSVTWAPAAMGKVGHLPHLGFCHLH